MKQVITIQHTQSVQHTNGMVGSWTDWELTALGQQHAQAIGETLAAALAQNDVALFCSDLTRAKQTAMPLAQRLGIDVQYRKELRELNLGEACGKTKQWMREHETAVDTVDDRAFPNAESVRDLFNRLQLFCQELIASTCTTAILVSHGFTLSVWPAVWLGLDVEIVNRVSFAGTPGCVSFMELGSDGTRRIRQLNNPTYIIKKD